MKNFKITICVLALFTVLCGTLFADAKKDREKINTYLNDLTTVVELAEKAAKDESFPTMAKAEGKMAGLQAKFAFIKPLKEFNDKDQEKYNALMKRYGKAHGKFGKEVAK